MSKPPFPGTSVGSAMHSALQTWTDKLPALSSELTRIIERNGNISADALHDIVSEATNAFGERLYRELKKQGVNIT